MSLSKWWICPFTKTRLIHYIEDIGACVSALFTKSLKHLPDAADHAKKPWQLIKEREEIGAYPASVRFRIELKC
jgi:hypothetical protein